MQSVSSCQSTCMVFIVDLAALYHVDDDSVLAQQQQKQKLTSIQNMSVVCVTLLTCLITDKFLFLLLFCLMRHSVLQLLQTPQHSQFQNVWLATTANDRAAKWCDVTVITLPIILCCRDYHLT